MIVNQEFVEALPTGQSQRDWAGRVHGWGEWFTIVGVAKDSKYHRVTESHAAVFLHSYPPDFPARVWFDIRCANFWIGERSDCRAAPRGAGDRSGPDLVRRPADDGIRCPRRCSGQKIAASLLSVLSGLGLLLAAIGLYSVMAYAVGSADGGDWGFAW